MLTVGLNLTTNNVKGKKNPSNYKKSSNIFIKFNNISL